MPCFGIEQIKKGRGPLRRHMWNFFRNDRSCRREDPESCSPFRTEFDCYLL